MSLTERYDKNRARPAPYKYIAPASAAKRLGSPSQTMRAMFEHVDAVSVGQSER